MVLQHQRAVGAVRGNAADIRCAAIRPNLVNLPHRCVVRPTSQLPMNMIDNLPIAEWQGRDIVSVECQTVLDAMRTLAAMYSKSSTIRWRAD